MCLKQNILQQAKELFFLYGIRSVTMDDIASKLGISKKTIYQVVKNKSDLIRELILAKSEADVENFKLIKTNSSNAIEEMLSFARYLGESIRQMSPVVIYDLQKYYRDNWSEMEAERRKVAYDLIKENIEHGQQQGLYRATVNADIIARLHVATMLQIIREEIFPIADFAKDKIVEEYILYHVHALVSPKGRALLDQHLAMENEQTPNP